MQSLLATSRMAVGLGFLTIPKHVAALFNMPFSPEASIGCRMAGSRDIILGALLYTCYSKQGYRGTAVERPKNGDQHEQHGWTDTQRALLAGVVVDALDVLACWWCYCDGALPLTPALLLGGGAAVLCDIGAYCLYVQSR
ncbi:hypothetical protein ASPVEDRAFT_82697 [Aspergillus versicolor CBS 583.65]|uniref:Uncharacterized protein n=1 Tax=Aspergillus versicolor CBS 583.65 TaxID=1036611 RepID=A0A1L9PI19_ASPVE|nr:uncharacterized protein ASPVEDRAFT_82697 [Aspergillus versicolor CBS 583.65]OJJ01159.1 hypothetical protein ASPVEDRAFT_82697 [Aspergillus versicolor CBS 583.65]